MRKKNQTDESNKNMKKSHIYFFIVLIILLGVILRALLIITPHMDSDQAIGGLMALHILKGEFPIFFWGSPYCGTIESFVAAILFFLFGPSRYALNSAPLLISLFFIIIMYKFGKDMYGVKFGLAAMFFASLAPPYLIWHSTLARANYIENLTLGTLLLLITYKIVFQENTRAKEQRLYALLGLTAGIAWWENFQSIHYLITAGFFIFIKDKLFFLKKKALIAISFFFLGSLPFWIYNIIHSFGSATTFKGSSITEKIISAKKLLLKYTVILGVKPGLNDPDFYFFSFIATVIFILSIAGVIYWRRLGILSLAKLSIKNTEGIDILIVFTIVHAFIISVTEYGTGDSPRYMLPLYTSLPFLIIYFLFKIGMNTRTIAFITGGFLIFSNLAANYSHTPLFHSKWRNEYWAAREEDNRLVKFLISKNIDRVYVNDFWLGPRLTFDTGEKIILAEAYNARNPYFTYNVDDSYSPAYLLSRGQSIWFDGLLQKSGITFKKEKFQPYVLYYDFSPPQRNYKEIPPSEWKGTANFYTEEIYRAFDRNIYTRWSTKTPQAPGAYIQIELNKPRKVNRISWSTGKYIRDFPRAFMVEISPDGNKWVQIYKDEGWGPVLIWKDNAPRLKESCLVLADFNPVYTKYIRITQTGTDKVFWWSIAEMFIYEDSEGYNDLVAKQKDPLLIQANNYIRQENYKKALFLLWQMIERNPDYDEAYQELINIARIVGIEEEEFYDVIAQEYLKIGDEKKAIKLYKRAIQSNLFQLIYLEKLKKLYTMEKQDDEVKLLNKEINERFSPSIKVNGIFSGSVEFLGYDIEDSNFKKGGDLRIKYYWKCLKKLDKDYAIFVHFKRKKEKFQDDHIPLKGEYLTYQWKVGDIIKEDSIVKIPDDISSGEYDIYIGLWDYKETHKRLWRTILGLKIPKTTLKIGNIMIH